MRSRTVELWHHIFTCSYFCFKIKQYLLIYHTTKNNIFPSSEHRRVSERNSIRAKAWLSIWLSITRLLNWTLVRLGPYPQQPESTPSISGSSSSTIPQLMSDHTARFWLSRFSLNLFLPLSLLLVIFHLLTTCLLLPRLSISTYACCIWSWVQSLPLNTNPVAIVLSRIKPSLLSSGSVEISF